MRDSRATMAPSELAALGLDPGTHHVAQFCAWLLAGTRPGLLRSRERPGSDGLKARCARALAFAALGTSGTPRRTRQRLLGPRRRQRNRPSSTPCSLRGTK